MKRLFFIMIAVVAFSWVHAQPGGSDTPYVVDNTFSVTVDFLQKTWTGEYAGIDPDSRAFLKIYRKLVLNKDLSFVNEVKVYVSETETLTMRQEIGTYSCSEDKIVYKITDGTVLDMKSFFQGTELVYSSAVDYSEPLQFTKEDEQGQRSWILFDERLKSQIDPNRNAVYLLTGGEIASHINSTVREQGCKNMQRYRISGIRSSMSDKGIQIIDGKKIFVR